MVTEQAENSTKKPQAKRAPRKSTVVDQRTSEDTCTRACTYLRIRIPRQPSNDNLSTAGCLTENPIEGSASAKGGNKRVAAKQPRKALKTVIIDESGTPSDNGTNPQNFTCICEASLEQEGSPIKVCVVEVPSIAKIEGAEANSKRMRKPKKTESSVMHVRAGDTPPLPVATEMAGTDHVYGGLSSLVDLPAVKDTEETQVNMKPERVNSTSIDSKEVLDRGSARSEIDTEEQQKSCMYGVDRIIRHSNTPRTPREEIQRLRSLLTSYSHLQTVDLCLKWTNYAQSALLLLSSITSVPVSQLLTKLGLSTELVLYDAENEDFEPFAV